MVASLFLVLLGAIACVSRAQNTFVGAVAEHAVVMGSASDSDAAKLQKNLDLYTGLVRLAKSRGVQILVFPEFGLVPNDQSGRESLYPFAEKIGDVVNNNASAASTPCGDAQYNDRPILQQMSCAARDNALALLVNMVDWVDCAAAQDADCPADGHYQYNTNVVFDEAGRLLVKYYKSHEFPSLRKAYDAVSEPSEVTYQSSFGVEFGIFTCFDIMFPDPAVRLRKRGVTHFLYPVEQGQLGEDTIIERWSRQQKAVLLSSNLGAGEAKRGGDCSGLLLQGEPLPADKLPLRDFDRRFAASPDNLLVANVPF